MRKKGFEKLLAGVLATAMVLQIPSVNRIFSVGRVEAEAASAGVVYESEESIAVEDIDFSALSEEDWGAKKEVVYAYTNDAERNVNENFTVDAKITVDADAYNSLSDGGYLKFQGVVKLTDDWTYTTGDSWPMIDQSGFTEENGVYTADIQIEFRDKTPSKLMEVDFEIVGVKFVGKVNISNVKVTSLTSDKPELEEKDPTILSDLATEADFLQWETEEGWDYYHGGASNSVPVISYDSEGQRLQIYVDYSANSTSTWSEAKVKYTPEEASDLSNYNQLSVDFIYPDSLDGTKMKFFADGIINKDLTVDESAAEDLGSGMKKVTVSMGFSPTTTPLSSLTIGIIGCQTGFQGNVYLDNLVLSQKNEVEDFVEIIKTPGAGTQAVITNSISSVKMADSDADDSAVALFTYLLALSENDQVLFGHQNDVSRAVNSNAALGDVEDITGSVSGIFGIDSLALTGSEAGGTDAASALANSIEYSKTAAENGALITLSTHMPNFTNAKISKREDGTYDFFECNFNESKDLSNNSAEQILPGGAYNEVFNAYLDIVAEYANTLAADNIPVIFRPLHENTGSWFWWGSTNSIETYKSLFRYTRDYLESQGVHNMLYVYSPNGPLTSEEEYLVRYPGDEYVDIVAFDYYDDYNTYPASSDGSYFTNLNNTCKVVSDFAAKRGKIAAIAECGVRVMKADGSDNEGLLVKGNPVREEAAGTNWYQKVNDIAKANNMPYYLVWANFSDTNFYVPYRYDDTYGHEMINEFIAYYNSEDSVFGNGTNFYNNMETLKNKTTETYTNPYGYMVYPFDKAAILSATELCAVIKNASKVEFVIENTETGVKVTLEAVPEQRAGKAALNAGAVYTAALDQETMNTVGKTDQAEISLYADGNMISKLSNVSIGKEKDKAPAHIIENFDYYSGSNGLLDASYSANSAAGCSSEFVLDTMHKNDGTYGGAFHYRLSTTGSEVWTGRIKSELSAHDFSAYNALEMWVQPDGKGQKLVIQLTDSTGEEFEVYLTNFVKGTKAQYVTVPFGSFRGKNGGTLKTDSIEKFAVWCNSVIPEGNEGTWDVDSVIYFDGIKAVSLKDEDLTRADADGLIITDGSLVPENPQKPEETDKPAQTPDQNQTQTPDQNQGQNQTQTPNQNQGQNQTQTPDQNKADNNPSNTQNVQSSVETGDNVSSLPAGILLAFAGAITGAYAVKRRKAIG